MTAWVKGPSKFLDMDKIAGLLTWEIMTTKGRMEIGWGASAAEQVRSLMFHHNNNWRPCKISRQGNLENKFEYKKKPSRLG